MKEEKHFKKRTSPLKIQIVKERAHFLKWLDGRLCVRKGKICSVVTEFKNGKLSISETIITPEILVNTDRTIKILSRFYKLTPKLFGKNFLEEKMSKYEELKQYLSVSILKKGFDKLDFKTLLIITPHFNPPPDTIIRKVKKDGLPKIDIKRLPKDSKKLYYYLEGCIGIHREDSFENKCGRRFPFAKDPILLNRVARYLNYPTAKKLVHILDKGDEFIHELLWEILYKDFSIDKIKYVIEHAELLAKVRDLALYIPFIKNLGIIKRILEMHSFEDEKIKMFIELSSFNQLIGSVSEDALYKILRSYESDEFIQGTKGILSMWPELFESTDYDVFDFTWYEKYCKNIISDYNAAKSVIFTHVDEVLGVIKNFEKIKIYPFAFHNMQNFNHFLNFCKKEGDIILQKMHPIIIYWLYKNFDYQKIEDILHGFVNIYTSVRGSCQVSPRLVAKFHLCKDQHFLRTENKILGRIKEEILRNCDRMMRLSVKYKFVEDVIDSIFINFSKLMKYFAYIPHVILWPDFLETDSFIIGALLSYIISSEFPNYFCGVLPAVLLSMWVEWGEYLTLSLTHASCENFLKPILSSNILLELFRLFLCIAFLQRPREIVQLLLGLLRISKHVDVIDEIVDFTINFKPKVKIKVRQKAEIERELAYLKSLKTKTPQINRRIENLEKILENYESYKKRMIEKQEKKEDRLIACKFAEGLKTLVNGLYLRAFYKDSVVKIKVDENIRKAIYFYLNLKYNKRRAHEAIDHMIKGDYRTWLLNLALNKKFIEKLNMKGKNTEPLITGFSLKLDNFNIGIETDPFKIMLMGEIFQTCLSLDKLYNYAVVPYLVDINKKVIYMKDKRGKIIARARLDISDEGYMKMMRIYSHIGIEKVEMYFKKFIKEFSKTTGIKLGNRGNFGSLHKLMEEVPKL